MKLDARQARDLVRDAAKWRAVLLHGEDDGQIRETARALIRAVLGAEDDPFRFVELDRDGWANLAVEVSSIALTGGRRVIRVRDVTDGILENVKTALASPGDALIILEAPGLGKGKLRTYFDAAKQAATMAFYVETGRALEDSIRAMLSEQTVTAAPDVVAWIAQSVPGDRAAVRGEIEKLALFAGPGGTIDLDDARLCLGEAGSIADDAILLAMRGAAVEADAAAEAAMAEGAAAIAVLRMALSLCTRLHQCRLRMAAGVSAQDAVRELRPPVFFKAAGAMAACLRIWPEAALLRASEECRQVEMACKQTGSRQELLTRRFVAGLARQAKALAG